MACARFEKCFSFCFFEPHSRVIPGPDSVFPCLLRHSAALWRLPSLVSLSRFSRIGKITDVVAAATLEWLRSEKSVKVSFFSTQNPLLPDLYSNLTTYSAFTEDRQNLIA